MWDFALLLLGATVIGLSSALVRLSEMDPAAVAMWRMIFALPVFAAWALVERRGATTAPFPKGVTIPAIVAGAAFAIDLTTSNISLSLTTMTSFIILVHLAPVIVVAVAWFWFRERPTPTMLLALSMALGGAVLLVQSGRASGEAKSSLLGDFFAIVAAFGYAAFILGTRKARLAGGTGIVSFVSCLACGVGCLILALLLGERLLPHSANAWLMAILLGVGCHATGQGLSAYAVGTLGASLVSIVLVYGVAVTVFSGWLVFGEVPTLLQLAGGALVLAAVILCRPKVAGDDGTA
jgi:drug/metabolite transporter (DMT)-like permease